MLTAHLSIVICHVIVIVETEILQLLHSLVLIAHINLFLHAFQEWYWDSIASTSSRKRIVDSTMANMKNATNQEPHKNQLIYGHLRNKNNNNNAINSEMMNEIEL